MFLARHILTVILCLSISLAGLPALASQCPLTHPAPCHHCKHALNDHKAGHHHDTGDNTQCCCLSVSVALPSTQQTVLSQALGKAETIHAIENIHLSQFLWVQDRPPKQIS